MQLRRLSSSKPETTEQVVLTILRRAGTQTLDSLSSAAGLEWGQTFAVVDRLSRAGAVALSRTRACEYLVSIG